MAEHNYIIILAIAVIVVIQFYIWFRGNLLIREYISVFQDVHFSTSKAYIPLSEITNDRIKDLSDIFLFRLYQSKQ